VLDPTTGISQQLSVNVTGSTITDQILLKTVVINRDKIGLDATKFWAKKFKFFSPYIPGLLVMVGEDTSIIIS